MTNILNAIGLGLSHFESKLARSLLRATKVICTTMVFASSASAGITNGDFANGLTNWTIVTASSNASDFINLGVTSLGGCTSVDNQNYAVIQGRKSGGVGVSPPANDNTQPISASFSASSHAGAIGTGVVNPGNVLKLGSSVTTGAGYDVVHGPAAVSDAFTANAGDVLSFDWYAKYVSDDFAVTAYLQKTDCSTTVTGLVATGTRISGMSSTPAASGTGWQHVQMTIATGGTYRFVFVSGTFDMSGGQAAGAELYISNVASGLSQTISFATPAAQSVGVPLTASATASSGLLVAYSSTTASICTVSGATVTFLAAGTCTLTATQSGNATYVPAAPVSVSFPVSVSANVAPTAGSVTITGTAQAGSQLTGSYTYADSDAPPDAQDTGGTGTSYRFVSATNVGMTSGVSNVATGTTGGTNKTYTPVAGDVGKYLFYCVTPKAATGTLTGTEVCSIATAAVSLLPQAITGFAPTSPVTFGASPATLTATGGASGSPVVFATTSANTICTVSGSTVTFVGVGVCNLTANQAAGGNYSAAPQVTASITISQATSIPTLSEWGLIILSGLLALGTLLVMRRRQF